MKVLSGIMTIGLALILWAGWANADIVNVAADFDGGGTDVSPVTNVVDAYNGTAGDGWAEGWYKYSYNATYTVGTSSATPLATGAGNYLDLTMTPTVSSGNGRYGSVHRSYAMGIDLSQPHSMQFKYRVNEDISNANPDFGLFTTSTDRYQLFDTASYSQCTANANCSWVIGCYGGEATWLSASKRAHWVVFNGDNNDTAFTDERNIDTGITVTQGTVYDFRIDIDTVTKTWDVRIGTGGTTLYDSTGVFPDGLGWRTKNSAVAGLPHFGSYGDASTDTRSYSFDSVKITGTSRVWRPTITAHFAGGNTDTVVDAYVGQPGEGWQTAWATAVTRADIVAAVVLPGDMGFSELHSGKGAYLRVEATQNTADTQGLAAVTRNYKTTTMPGIDWTKQHTIKFTVRVDEDVATFTDFDDRYLMFDSTASRSGTSADCTWMVTAYGGEGAYAGADVVRQWSFYNGDRAGSDLIASLNVDTNIDITTGGVYDFTIVVNPVTQSYDATVSDGTNSFTATDLGWRTSAKSVGGYLSFGARSSALGELRAISLDEVIVTTETTTPTIPGDTNGNGVVDAEDAKVVAQNWGANVGTAGFAAGDFNGDQLVNAADASILAANWGNHNGESAASVPEPSAITLLVTVLVLAMAGRRARR
jgi:hypothetical protein